MAIRPSSRSQQSGQAEDKQDQVRSPGNGAARSRIAVEHRPAQMEQAGVNTQRSSVSERSQAGVQTGRRSSPKRGLDGPHGAGVQDPSRVGSGSSPQTEQGDRKQCFGFQIQGLTTEPGDAGENFLQFLSGKVNTNNTLIYFNQPYQ